jgi:aspartate carbamoyltransferase catalytic subunit
MLLRKSEIKKNEAAFMEGSAERVFEDRMQYEPSAGERLFFDTSMKRLGGEVIDMGVNRVKFGGQGRKSCGYHKGDRELCGHYRIAASQGRCGPVASEYSKIPIINAGGWAGHRSTQALLDQVRNGFRQALVSTER